MRGRTLARRTTTGTAGALAVADAGLLLCASFPVVTATAEVPRGTRARTVTFVVTGDDGRAAEGLACAECLAARVRAPGTGSGRCPARACRSAAAGRLAEGVRHGRGGVHPGDVELCLEADADPFAMAATRLDGHPVPRPVS
ncbi:hypothetical protein ACFY8K_01260 [Streptomyces misionensis]|uniref:hypothetical protein n=1 Tax=Streptomyces misionensis TaxID=67331 RepID=UPI0036A96BAE